MTTGPAKVVSSHWELSSFWGMHPAPQGATSPGLTIWRGPVTFSALNCSHFLVLVSVVLPDSGDPFLSASSQAARERRGFCGLYRTGTEEDRDSPWSVHLHVVLLSCPDCVSPPQMVETELRSQ